MRTIYTASYLAAVEAKKKQKGVTYEGEHFKVNPWAVCNKSTGGKEEVGKAKFERCVHKVKDKSKD